MKVYAGYKSGTYGLHLYTSDDEGVTWTFLSSVGYGGASVWPRIINVIDEGKTVVVVGGTTTSMYIRRSANSGVTWLTVKSKSNYDAYSSCISPANEQYMFACGEDGYFYKSTDGGATWSESRITGHTYTDWRGIYFASNTVGWICGAGYILKTTNGGTDWTEQVSSGGRNFLDIFGIDATYVWAQSGSITYGCFRTTNGGTDWTEHAQNADYILRQVDAVDSTHVWAVGASGTNLHVLRSVDGGQTWAKVTVVQTGSASYATIHFISSTVGYMNAYSFYKSVDGGQTWNEQGTRSVYVVSTAYNTELWTEIRGFDIALTEPADRTDGGYTLEIPLHFGTQLKDQDSQVKCIIFRVRNVGVNLTISNMKFYLQSKSGFVGANSYYCDVSSTWTQDKSVAQVSGGTPGTIPESLPGSANVTKIDGGDITDVGHADTSQYIYLAMNMGSDETDGMKSLTYRIQFDYA